MHGFTNVSDTIAELYQGVNKSHPEMAAAAGPIRSEPGCPLGSARERL